MKRLIRILLLAGGIGAAAAPILGTSGGPTIQAAPAPANVFIAAIEDFTGTLAAIDTLTHSITELPAFRPWGVTVTPDGRTMFAALPFLDEVTVVDVATATTIATIPVDPLPFQLDVTPDGNEVWVGSTSGASTGMQIIDVATNTVTDFVGLGTRAGGVAFSPDGSLAFVGTQAVCCTGQVLVVDTTTRAVITQINVGNTPAGIDFTPDGSRAYVANRHSRDVYVIDTASLGVIAVISLGFGTITDLKITPDGSTALVADALEDELIFVDTATNTVDGSIFVPRANFPNGIGIDPSGARAYVAGAFAPADEVTCFTDVIDIATRTKLDEVPISCGVHQVAVAPPPFMQVEIDIKPGSEPNSINVGSNGKVAVAIFSSPDFDATLVDPLSVTLASGAVWLKGNGTPMSSFSDVDGDGLTDIVVHVATESLLLSDGDTEAVLNGETVDGIAFTGSDTVRIVPG